MGVEAGGPGPGSQRPTGHLAESSAWKGPGKGLEASGKARGGSRKPEEAQEGPRRSRTPRGKSEKAREAQAFPRGPGRPLQAGMAQWAAQPQRGPCGAQGRGLRRVVLPGRRRAPRGLGGRVTPERLCAWAAAGDPAAREYRWTWWNARPPGAPPLSGSCRETRPVGKLAEPQPRPRQVSLGVAWALGPTPTPAPARGPRSPYPVDPAALEAARRPLCPPLQEGRGRGGALQAVSHARAGAGASGRRTRRERRGGHLGLRRGKINKKYLEIPVEQLMPEPNLSAHTQESTQNSKQGIFQLWNCPLNEGSTIEKREFKKSSVETGFNVTTNPIRVFTLSHPFTSTSADEQVGPYPGLLVPLGLCWPHADGDFFKNRNEIQFSSYSTIENNDGETLPAPNWNLKHGSSSVEENLTDESDLSENEKANDTLLSSFKKVDLNLKPETIKNVEEPFTEEPNEVFPYPDFLPPAFSTLDLHNLALSKSDHWKATLEPAESSVEQLITRLLELERLQHMTIQKERPRLPTTFCTPAVTERPSSSKATPKARQPKLCASLSLQIPCVDKSQEKSKNNSGSCKLEQNTLKWNWSNAGKYKWNTRPPSLKSSSITKQLIETYDKNPKSSILNPCQELSSKPTTGQTTQPPVKMVSTRCLPSRSPVPVSPIPLSFPENQKEEIKAPKRNFGTKKKLYRQNTVWNRPFSIQKLNCLSPSLIAKDKCCSPIEQK
ncbi:PREDICTED: protein FAM217A isoform X4 [Rhinopithecus bieti]|uniref:protein FAM217A isoform X4 n=1 Tax=Rhinopithecus bieti TaxID=61621 RepID=UPI00083BC7FC|nr:PREDICTED: protein FAM217A isoform X4 [Rhinopithecus bieti]